MVISYGVLYMKLHNSTSKFSCVMTVILNFTGFFSLSFIEFFFADMPTILLFLFLFSFLCQRHHFFFITIGYFVAWFLRSSQSVFMQSAKNCVYFCCYQMNRVWTRNIHTVYAELLLLLMIFQDFLHMGIFLQVAILYCHR